jgi:TRAP-type C4-dicarboxylate transport system permease small subunit
MTARLAQSLCALCFGLTAIGLVFLAVNGASQQNTLGSPAFDVVFSVVYLAFPVVGALIASRHPRNAIGWLFLAAGLGRAVDYAFLGYATQALVADPGSLPGGALAGLIADLTWVPSLLGGTALLFLLFPSGRLASRRWRPVVGLVAVVTFAYVAGTLLKAGPLYYFPLVDNPLGVEGGRSVTGSIVDASGFLAIALILVAVASLVARFRRARGLERQQFKWLASAAALLFLSTPVQPLLGGVELAGLAVGDALFGVLISLVPIAVGIAILRHRLYDIDLVIRRTLVYAALTATLGAVYFGLVVLIGLAAGDSGVAVAGSTLAVAALSRPALARIQAVVDRRFYRRRYDAARTLQGFGNRLRDELDLETVGGDLRGVVRETMQPAHVSLWLRKGSG